MMPKISHHNGTLEEREGREKKPFVMRFSARAFLASMVGVNVLRKVTKTQRISTTPSNNKSVDSVSKNARPHTSTHSLNSSKSLLLYRVLRSDFPFCPTSLHTVSFVAPHLGLEALLDSLFWPFCCWFFFFPFAVRVASLANGTYQP
jgi:hypothetical protein